MIDHQIVYPNTQQSQQQDNYHGIQIADPYRWLENPDSPDTKDWINEQNKITTEYLSAIASKNKIEQRLTQLWDYEKYSSPFKRGQRYFYFKNDGLQNQSVLYTLNSLEAEAEVLLDPNLLSADGTIALSGLSISDDGNWLAYGLSTAGSDWVEYRVRDINTKEDCVDHLRWIKFSGAAWTKDHQGFFYSRYDEVRLV
ncbi:prolyl endopeptidase [Chondrocystis sp. NIES-4102]|nr:prolyl endopeptidase [Chondrocystis sp. NIES-4102]